MTITIAKPQAEWVYLICNSRAGCCITASSASVPILPRRVTTHRIDIDALKQPMELLGRQLHDRLLPARPDKAVFFQALVTYLGMQAVLLPRRSLFA